MVFWNSPIALVGVLREVGALREAPLQGYPDYLLQTFKEILLAISTAGITVRESRKLTLDA
jgi:hypothetical protein